MGAWGISIYANDAASDIRGDYLDLLRRGQNGEEASRAIITKYDDLIRDPEEEPLFWYALSDTQWNYGRLQPEVKEKALFFLESNVEMQRWIESGKDKAEAWSQTLLNLREKLLSPQPAEKKVYQHRLYACPWNIGDVFACKFQSTYSREKGYYGSYYAFRMVSNQTIWPGHIAPVVQFYMRVWDTFPRMEDFRTCQLLPAFFPAASGKTKNYYNVQLITESKKAVSESRFIHLGNVEEDLDADQKTIMFPLYQAGLETGKSYPKLETFVIDHFDAWRETENPLQVYNSL